MKTLPLRSLTRGINLFLIFMILLTSCTARARSFTSSGSLRAWIDQPAGGFTLQLAPFKLKAHARQDGGGVTEVKFIVNGTLLGSVPTNASDELTSAALDWNPSAPGFYRIQAIALNATGQQAPSEVSLVCISQDPGLDCSGAPISNITPTISSQVDATIKVVASPNPVSIGAACKPSDRMLSFDANVADTGGAAEVDVHGYLVGISGGRTEFYLALSPVSTTGSFIGTLDTNTIGGIVLGDADGTIEFELALLNNARETFRTSTKQTITAHNCKESTPITGTIRINGAPNPVFIGLCTAANPTTIEFDASTDYDPARYDHVDLGYVWLDAKGIPLGTANTENRVRMTQRGIGSYGYSLNTNGAPVGLSSGGSIKFWAIVSGTDAMDIAFSDNHVTDIIPCVPPLMTITAIPYFTLTPFVSSTPVSCSAYNNIPKSCKAAGCFFWSDKSCREKAEPTPTIPLSCSTYTKLPVACQAAGCYYWSNTTCSENPEPPPALSCSAYNNIPKSCKAAGCFFWSDKSCKEKAEPTPTIPPSCSTYDANADGCKSAGCYFWSNATCSENPEPNTPTPASCSTYTYLPDACQSADCYYWSNTTCSEKPEPPSSLSCSSIFNPLDCLSGNCFWDLRSKSCKPK